jgi:hypothetical protein
MLLKRISIRHRLGTIGTIGLALALGGCGESSTDPAAQPGSDAGDAGADSPVVVDSSTPPVELEKLTLGTEFYAEGAGFGDFDADGDSDVVAGPYWYEGPEFTTKHEIYTPFAFDPKVYSDNFFAFVRDFDGDGALDVLTVGFPGKNATWYQNSKQPGVHWTRHDVALAVDTESPVFTDLTGDGQPELVCAVAGQLGWLEPGADATVPWTFHPLSPPGPFAPFTHGLGVGDVDGDGRKDVIEARGIWIQPASLAGDPFWGFVQAQLGTGGAQMFAMDVEGDGDPDVITSLAAHGFGVSWFEQTAPGAFTEHNISPPDEASAGALHEPHALSLVDVNGDGLEDVVTGERFWGHVPAGDPQLTDPAELVWFELVRQDGVAHYLLHVVDDQSGVGTDVTTGDISGDGKTDILVANKKGTFVFLQK